MSVLKVSTLKSLSLFSRCSLHNHAQYGFMRFHRSVNNNVKIIHRMLQTFPNFSQKYGSYTLQGNDSYTEGSDDLWSSKERFNFADFATNLQKPDWNHVQLQAVKKDFFTEVNNSTQPSAEIVDFMEKNNMTIKHGVDDSKLYSSLFLNFTDYMFPDFIQKNLDKKSDFERPTPIQAATWPIALSGRDVIGIGQTGCGKTLAYLLPAFVHILGQSFNNSRDPVVLVIVPTRELAQQVTSVSNEFGRPGGIRTVSLYGGVSRLPQLSQMSRGVDVCVATPGRLLDLLSSDSMSVHAASYLVLDEADRMLDMGFEPQIRAIVDQVRPDRQTMMFSATWPMEVRSLAASFFTEEVPHFINIGSMNLSANPNIKQIIEVCEDKDKVFDDLIRMLQSESENDKILIFCETKRNVDTLFYKLRRRNVHNVMHIHGDRSQKQRDMALNAFRTGRCPILIATDVASRGLDVSDIKYVINYDFPHDFENYVHRIGRTARHEKKGTSYTLFTKQDSQFATDLIDVLHEAKQEIPESLREMVAYSKRMERRKKLLKEQEQRQKRLIGTTRRRKFSHGGGSRGRQFDGNRKRSFRNVGDAFSKYNNHFDKGESFE